MKQLFTLLRITTLLTFVSIGIGVKPTQPKTASFAPLATLTQAGDCDQLVAAAEIAKYQVFPHPAQELPKFEDYPVNSPPFTGNHSPIDFNSHPQANTFRDNLNYGIQYGPNFAQHYTIVTWGCGTLCEVFAIVDAYTGAVYFPGFSSSVGLDFRLNSNLLIVNPPENLQSTTVPPGIETEYFIWQDNQLIPIQ